VHCSECNYNAEKTVIKWIQKNKKISWLYFLTLYNKKINIEDNVYKVKRTNGTIEKDWCINISYWIKYDKNSKDFIVSVVKYNLKKFIFKNVTLKHFCELNHSQFNYDKCKTILQKWILPT
jgi:hypothetical protein